MAAALFIRGARIRYLQNTESGTMKMRYSPVVKRILLLAGLMTGFTTGSAFAQNKAIGFKPGMPFSDGYVAGNTLYVAGQQGRDAQGNLTGGDISQQTTTTLATVKKIVEGAGFKMTDIVSVTVYVTSLDDVPKMNEVYKALMPDPKPARATVQVAGLIGGARIEISAVAVKH
jgi:2-iminobutanoate/2-iminopropanoate deaminase